MFLKAKCRYWKNREMHILKKWISVILTVDTKLCKLSLKACVDNDDLYVDTAGPQKWTIHNFSLFTLFSWKVWVFIEKQNESRLYSFPSRWLKTSLQMAWRMLCWCKHSWERSRWFGGGGGGANFVGWIYWNVVKTNLVVPKHFSLSKHVRQITELPHCRCPGDIILLRVQIFQAV